MTIFVPVFGFYLIFYFMTATKVKTIMAVIMLLITSAIKAQVTSSSINGKITDEKNETVIGAVIKAVHEPSGTTYKTVTDRNGRYSVTGMKAGGPYKVEISYIGYRTAVVKGIRRLTHRCRNRQNCSTKWW